MNKITQLLQTVTFVQRVYVYNTFFFSKIDQKYNKNHGFPFKIREMNIFSIIIKML